jgi:peptidoglycan/LPS O-acetylase OafA/YrhL
VSKAQYRPDIDGLRALAVLAVVGYHAFPHRLPGGFIGVDIFFVISGFLISQIIFSELSEGRFSFINFYARRARRLFPALVLVLTSCAFVGWFTLLADEYAQLGKHMVASAGFVQNLILLTESGYFDIAAELKPLLHLWSLGIEEQFYIVWPLALYWLWRRPTTIGPSILICAALSFAACYWMTPLSATSAFFLPITRFWELLLGAAIAWQQRTRFVGGGRVASAVRMLDILSVGGLLLMSVGLATIDHKRDFPASWALLPVVGTMLLIYAGPNAWVNRRLLSNKALVWIGLISYPLYLWHWPLLAFARILENQLPSGIVRLALVLCAVVLAWLTYILVERPIRLNVNRRMHSVMLLWALMLGVAVFGVWLYLAKGLPSREVVVASQSTAPLLKIDMAKARGCEGEFFVERIKQPPPQVLKHCTIYAGARPTKTIVFWGDSSVSALQPVFGTIANEQNYALITLMHMSCPPILNARKTTFSFEESKRYCADGRIQGEIVSYLRGLNPDLIVLAASWSSYFNREYVTNHSFAAADAASSRVVFENELPKTIDSLIQIAPLVVFKDWPIMPERPNARTIRALGYQKQPVSIARSQFDEWVAPVNKIFDQVHSQTIRYVDPAEKVCDNQKCYSARDGLLYYQDAYHMTSQAAMQFKTEIEALLSNN